MNKNQKNVRFCFFFWFFKNCELIRDSSLCHSNFIHLVRDSVIIIKSRSVTYTFGSHFACKRWVKVFYQNLNFSFLRKVFQYYLLGLKVCRLGFASFCDVHQVKIVHKVQKKSEKKEVTLEKKRKNCL